MRTNFERTCRGRQRGGSETKGGVWQIPKHLFPRAEANYRSPHPHRALASSALRPSPLPRFSSVFLSPPHWGPHTSLIFPAMQLERGLHFKKDCFLERTHIGHPHNPLPRKKLFPAAAATVSNLGECHSSPEWVALKASRWSRELF